MRKPVIALATTAAILGGFVSIAAINSDSSSAQKLTGKYALVYSDEAHYGVVQDVRIEQLADRAFIVFSPAGERRGEGDCWLPLKSVTRLRVFDALEEALAAQQNKPAKSGLTGNANAPSKGGASAKGVVTVRGKPLANATLRLHAEDGLAFSAALTNDGTYLIEHIPQGSYVVTVDGNGVKPEFRSPSKSQLRVDVKPGVNALDFSLE